MHQPAKWWIGLLPLAIVWVIACLAAEPRIEADLAARARAVFADVAPQRLADGKVSVAGRDVAIRGSVFEPQGTLPLVGEIDDLWGVRLVDADLTTFPTARPYALSIKREGSKIVLDGDVPNPVRRAAIVDAARHAVAGADVVDNLAYAGGAPPAFAKTAKLAIAQLGQLVEGEASLGDDAVSLRGVASDTAVKAKIEREFPAGLVSPFKLATLAIREAAVSPYTFGIDKRGDEVHLTGHVPDETARRVIVAATTARFFDARIVDELKIGAGAPAGFVGLVTAALPGFARLSDGRLSLSDDKVEVAGKAAYAKAADDVRAALAGAAGGGFKLVPKVGVAPPGSPLEAAACTPKYKDLLAKGHVEFETGKAVLKPDSAPLLDDLVAITQRCDKAMIEVSGHTDTVGNAAANLDLSKRRAQAVVAYLSGAGLDTSRITATGYGQDKPVASNDTAEGRARNRRIEFEVK